MTTVVVSEIRFSPSPSGESNRGLLGWVSFVVNGAIRVDGVALRETMRGILTLSYPSKTTPSGGRHPYVLPVGRVACDEIQRQVLSQLGLVERPQADDQDEREGET